MFLSKYWAVICKFMPTKLYLSWQYWHVYKRKLNYKNPKTYADKIAYLKINKQDKRLSKLVDKYEVRNYVKEKIGEQYLIPLIGIYESVEEISWENLPNKYVIKCTHDSGSTIVHTNDKEFDVEKSKEFLKYHLKRNLYWASREYPYRNVKPRIICEEFLDDNGKSPSDYKIMCFNGKAEYIVLDMDRFDNHKRNIYDRKWNLLEFTTDHENSEIEQKKPEQLEKMLKLAEVLAEGYTHVRVDFYCVRGKIFFGEMTFFPWGGLIWFEPAIRNYELGEKIVI